MSSDHVNSDHVNTGQVNPKTSTGPYPESKTFKPRRRRLSPTRQRRFDALAPQWVLASDGPPLDLVELFGNDRPVVLDFGIGGGESCIEMAIAEPHHNLIGADVHTPGIARAVLAIEEHEITNLRLMEGDAMLFIARLPPGSLGGIRIFFPDPWPKPRHRSRRLVTPARMERLTRLITAGGFVHLATDIIDYAEQMEQVCNQRDDLVGGVIARPDSRPRTRYEQRGCDAGRTITDLWYTVIY